MSDDEPPAGAPILLQLPAGLLHSVWNLLPRTDHQHALRCTCTALRDLSNDWINELDIDMLDVEGEDSAVAWLVAMQKVEPQLSRFPKAAVLQGLRLTCRVLETDRVYDVVAGVVLAAGDRLATLQRLTVFGGRHTMGEMYLVGMGAATMPFSHAAILCVTFLHVCG